MPTRQEMLDDVRRMDDELDRTPRVLDVLHDSEFTRAAFRAEWDSWRGVIQAAIGRRSPEITRGEVLARLIELHRTVEQDPSIQTWSAETLYSPKAVYEDAGFDSWTEAKQSVGIVIWHRTKTLEFDE
jgi:hypothetical protein